MRGLKPGWLLLIVLLPFVAFAQQAAPTFYFGVDLSYVNEMEDCGAQYFEGSEARDPYAIFADHGANLVRVRLWHSPDWTDYSTLPDVTRSLRRAKALGMATLLDFHYSDTWADPSKQIVPAAWAVLTDPEALGQALYDYTFDVLTQLETQDLMPDIVQLGNEINSEILRPEGTSGYPIDWTRNASLLNRAIQAARDAGAATGTAPRIMLHIAQPENVEGWLLAAEAAGVEDFDIIGLSYYTASSDYTPEAVGSVINKLRYRFGKEVVIAETAYPWTLEAVNETAGNIPDQSFLREGYPAAPEGQRQFMTDLTQTVIASGGLGLIYWEPAWVSTACSTLWGQGSHWENATFFDFGHALHEGIDYMRADYAYPVTLRFVSETVPTGGLYFWGDFTGGGRRPIQLSPAEDGVLLEAQVMPGTRIRYQFYHSLPAGSENAVVPASCVDEDGYVNFIVPNESVTLTLSNVSCPQIQQP